MRINRDLADWNRQDEVQGGLTLLVFGRGDEMHYQGVGLLMGLGAEWEPVDERLLYARFKSNHGNISVFVCYAPLNSASDGRKDEFYDRLQGVVGRVARFDILLCVGDFNEVLGDSNKDFEKYMGRMGVENRMSGNGVRFATFCLANELMIGCTIFQHPNIHKTSCVSPCGKYRNHIDHIAISGRHKSSLVEYWSLHSEV